MRPGATDRIGIGTQALDEINPVIIEAHVTAFGWTGPYAHRPGLDPLAQALIGLQRAQGGPENPPVFLGGLAPNDYVAGPTECEDGLWVQLGCVHNRFVGLAASVMGIQDEIADPRFGDGRNVPTEEARKELYGIVADAIKTRPYEEWAPLFEEADVPYALVRTTQEAMDDPQVRLNEMVIQNSDPAFGAVSYMGLPVKLTGTPGRVKGGRTVPGQHTDNVLSALPEVEPPSSIVHGPRAEALEQPLEGVKVLETANVIAGPTAGKLLSVLGAEVIKLEPPDGDISRPATPPYSSSISL